MQEMQSILEANQAMVKALQGLRKLPDSEWQVLCEGHELMEEIISGLIEIEDILDS